MFSVIMPVSRDLLALQRALSSILSQTYQDFEVLLILNNCTSEFSQAVIKKYDALSKVRIIDLGVAPGVSSARNQGLDEVKGRWICFLDSDDYYFKNALSNRIRKVQANRYFMYHSQVKYVGADRYLGVSMAKGCKYFAKDMLVGNQLHLNGVTVDRSVVRNLRFKEALESGEDWVFLTECLMRSGGSISTRQVDCAYVQHGMSYVYKNYLEHEDRLLKAHRIICELLVDTFDTKEITTAVNKYKSSLRARQLIHLIFTGTNQQIISFYSSNRQDIQGWPQVNWNGMIRHYLMRRFLIPKSREHLKPSCAALGHGVKRLNEVGRQAPQVLACLKRTMLACPT